MIFGLNHRGGVLQVAPEENYSPQIIEPNSPQNCRLPSSEIGSIARFSVNDNNENLNPPSLPKLPPKTVPSNGFVAVGLPTLPVLNNSQKVTLRKSLQNVYKQAGKITEDNPKNFKKGEDYRTNLNKMNRNSNSSNNLLEDNSQLKTRPIIA